MGAETGAETGSRLELGIIGSLFRAYTTAGALRTSWIPACAGMTWGVGLGGQASVFLFPVVARGGTGMYNRLWLGEISRNRKMKRRELLVIGCWLSASSRFTVVSSQSKIGVHLPLRSFLSVPSVLQSIHILFS